MKETHNDNYFNLNFSRKINVIFFFPTSSTYVLKEKVVLYEKLTLENQFKDFLRRNIRYKLKKRYSFFLKKNKKFIKLLPNKTVSQLELENGDNIYISYNQINLESTENFNDNNISDR